MTTYTGTSGNDTWTGAGGDDIAYGAGGDDTLTGGLGNDFLSGDDGNDLLIGNKGDDTLLGGAGDDVMQFTGALQGFESLDGGSGSDTVVALSNNAVIGLSAISNVEFIDAGTFINVSILGSSAANVLDFSGATLTGITLIDGGDGDDTIIGSDGADTIRGNAGNDHIEGKGANDILQYSGALEGFDSVDGKGGSDKILALADNTVIGLTSIANVEKIDGDGHLGVYISGSSAADALDFSAVLHMDDITSIDGGAGNDSITGSALSDTIHGGAGNDVLIGDGLALDGAGDLFVYSGTNEGFDAVDGQDGLDTITAAADNTIIGLTSIASVETITGGGFSGVSISGSSAADVLNFSGVLSISGIVSIDGGGGNDSITGSIFSDTLGGGAGDDTFYYTGAATGFDNIDGGTGANTILATAAGTSIGLHQVANISLISAGGLSGVSIAGSSAADTLNLSGVILSGIAEIGGGDGNDTITGTALADTIRGGLGDDSLNGGNGDDLFMDDAGSSGYDAIDGGAGTDTIAINGTLYLSYVSNVEYLSSTGGIFIFCSNGNDYLDFSSTSITGGGYISLVQLNDGNDTFFGGTSSSSVWGGAGDDSIVGGANNDFFTGGWGHDTMFGGAGDDWYQYVGQQDSPYGSTPDVVYLNSGEADKIDLSSIDADPDTAGNQAFSFIGTSSFSGANGEIRVSASISGGYRIQIVMNYDGIPDMEIDVHTSHTLSSSDFIL